MLKCAIIAAMMVAFILFCRYELDPPPSPQGSIVPQAEEATNASALVKDEEEEGPEMLAIAAYAFEDDVDHEREDCDYHHAQHNAPGWSCDHCREQRQALISCEAKVHELQATLKVNDTELQGHRFHAEKFEPVLIETMDQNHALSAEIAELKIRLNQAINRARTAESLARSSDTICTEKSQTLDTIRGHHAHVLDMNRNLQAVAEENDIVIENLRLDLRKANKANENLKENLARYQVKMERQLHDYKDQMEFMMEFQHPLR